MMGRQNLAIFRLSCACGLRVSEIAALNLGDVLLEGDLPAIKLRRMTVKGKKRGRLVPLWWDKGTVADLRMYDAFIRQYLGQWDQPMPPTMPFIFRLGRSFGGRPPFHRLSIRTIQRRWRTAIRVLGPARLKQLSIHKGRHSFLSHALLQGRNLLEVRDAAGHSNITTTNIYLHYTPIAERRAIPDLFDFSRPPEAKPPGPVAPDGSGPPG